MEPVPEDLRLLKGAYWLARLRWIAVVCVSVGTYVSSNLLNIALAEIALYIVAALLLVYNVAVRVLLDRVVKPDESIPPDTIKRIIHLQICADLILLTTLLHFSGGIENPLVFFFIFHVIIASILLTKRESYGQATFAVILFGLLLLLTQMRLSNKVEMNDFSLPEALKNVAGAVGAKAEDKSITLTCDIDPLVKNIYGNQFSIEEMITNLLLNAIKYTPAGGTITLNARNSDDCVLLEIADTGIGIPLEEQDKVFDEFFRAMNARRTERDGTGLGLSIVKYIVERHGGRITVESEEGRGTTFKLTLPKTP